MTSAKRLVMLAGVLALFAGTISSSRATETATYAAPPIGHVFLIVLENEPFHVSFGPRSPGAYLARQLPRRGALLTQYYGIGHYSLDNYIAMISGQAPNPDTQADCDVYKEFVPSGPVGAYGQLPGTGCVYPASVPTIADQLEAKHLTWMGYMQDMGNNPRREAATCGHAVVGMPDATERASAGDEYAAKHNPFVYFHALIDNAARCDAHVVNLRRLTKDLARVETTPNFAFITPNLCDDGHNPRCVTGGLGGLAGADRFLKKWIPRIMASPAYRKDGLIVITFDEGLTADSCCGEQGLPGGPRAGQFGPGGGRVGAVLLSPFIRPGTISNQPYNHYSLLRSVEDYFGLPPLGYAGAPGARPFGRDIFTHP